MTEICAEFKIDIIAQNKEVFKTALLLAINDMPISSYTNEEHVFTLYRWSGVPYKDNQIDFPFALKPELAVAIVSDWLAITNPAEPEPDDLDSDQIHVGFHIHTGGTKDRSVTIEPVWCTYPQ